MTKSAPISLFWRHPARGFTLVELLIVIAIIVIMVSLAANTLTFDQGRSAVSSAISELDGTFSTARLEARGKSTYTWICMKELDQSSGGGLAVAVYSTKDGTTNLINDNFVPVSPYKILKNVGIGEVSRNTPQRLADSYEESGLKSSDKIARVEKVTNPNDKITIQGKTFDTIVRYSPKGIPWIDSAKKDDLYFELLVYPLYGGLNEAAKSSSLLIQKSSGTIRKYW